MYERLPLYYNIEKDSSKPPYWNCARGTNIVESWHAQVHHSLPGGSNGPEHADAVIKMQAADWNRERAIKLGERPDVPLHDDRLIYKLNAVATAAGMPEPYPSMVPPKAPIVQELFGFDFTKDTLLAGELTAWA